MIKNYLKTAIRNLYNEKGLVSFSLLGLAVGLAAVILLLAYIRYELSYDTSYSHADRAFRLVRQDQASIVEQKSLYVPTYISNLMKEDLPQIAATTTLDFQGSASFLLEGGLFDVPYLNADSNFFKVFNIPFLYGDQKTALNDDNSIVIDKKTAVLFFNQENAVGKVMVWKNIYGEERLFPITGIIEEFPPNMHLKADAVVAQNPTNIPPINGDQFIPHSSIYLLLHEHATIDQVAERMPSFYKKHNFPEKWSLSFQHVRSIHLNSNLPDELFANNSIQYIYIFGLIALLVLVVACVNYINLATVRSLKRSKEIGVRKVLGSSRNALIVQFISESFLFFGLALPFAFLISWLAWPWFAHLLYVPAEIAYLLHWQTILLVIMVTLFSGLLSGAYPAFFLSQLKPIVTLKNTLNSFRINLGMRKVLIVFQFAISVSLIVATIVINKQLHLLNNAQLGYNKEHLLVLKSSKYPNGSTTFKSELLKHNKIQAASVSSFRIGENIRTTTTSADSSELTQPLTYANLFVDADFQKTMQLTLLEGRFASHSGSNESTNTDESAQEVSAMEPVILSQRMVKTLQLGDPVGKVFDNGYTKNIIAGVVEDFNVTSLKDDIPAVALNVVPDLDLGYTYIRITPGNVTETLRYIADTYATMFPYQKADLSFMDDRLQQLYTSEQRLAALFLVFVSIAIVIVCVGLFALVSLVVQQRTKEIGIRKVFGANTVNIIKLVAVDFIYLVLFGFLIATPVAWWVMNKWLTDYAQRIEMQWWVFAITGIGVLFLVLITVSLQATRAALAKPVDSLRDD